MSNKKKHTKYKKLNIKKLLLLMLFIAIMFGVYPALSKYISATPEQIITILTKYHVNYQTSGGKILEPEKFNTYVSQTGLTLPVEGEVTRTSYDFLGWYGDNNFTGEAITRIESGDYGDKHYFAAWNVSKHTLTVNTKDTSGNITSGLPEGYEIVIGKNENGEDNIITLDNNGSTIIGKNEIVSIRVPYSNDFYLEKFSLDNAEVVMTPNYVEGNAYMYINFTMPRTDLMLTYNTDIEDNYIDIAKSSIIFEEGVSIEGTNLTANGFWYKDTISGMSPNKVDSKKGNFYVWDNANPLYVTSNGVETQNQLILVNATTVYFKNCKLVATDEYKNDFIGRKFKNNQLDIFTISQLMSKSDMVDLSSYGNIVIKSTNDNVIKGLNFYIEGENTIGSIIQSYIRSSNLDILNIEGVDNGELDLGLLFYSACKLNINNITINEYENDFDYIIMLWKSNMTFSGVTLNASSKNIYEPDTMPIFNKYNKQRDSVIKLNNLRVNYMIYLNDRTYMHVYNDLYTTSGFQISGDSSLLVDGNAYLGTGGAYHTGIDTTGYVIIKGSISGSDLVFNKGTLIANTVGNSRGGAVDMNINGGTIITNLYSEIILPAVNLYSINTNSTSSCLYNINSITSMCNANNDNLPFIMASPINTNAASVRNKTFSGGKIYIFGDYQITKWNSYQIVDRSYHGQEVQNIISSLLVNGDIKESVRNGTAGSKELSKLDSDYLKQLVGKNKTDKTSFVIGRSDIDWSIIFRGTELYVAGNMNMRFKTNITGGKIVCYGSISCKHDITVNGDDVLIEADEIGNQLNLTQTTNNLIRYSTLSLIKGNLKVNRIGSVSQTINSITNRSTVVLSGNVSIEPLSGNVVTFIQDEYINYLLSNMTNSSQNPLNVRYKGTINLTSSSLVDYDDITWNLLTGDNDISSQNINLINPINESNDGKWVLGSENGNVVTNFAINGLITDTEYAPYQEKIALYAVKSKYSLQIKEGSSYISSIKYPIGTDNDELQYSIENNIIDNDEYEVYALDEDKKVTLELKNSSMNDKIIIWYYDGSGTLHNVMPKITSDGTTITFDMPMATTEIYITDDITLFLDKYEIVLTNYGFRTTWEAPTGQENDLFDDTCFNYLGNISIRQSNIKIDEYDTLSTAIYSVNPTTGNIINGNGNEYITSNRIRFLSDFDNVTNTSRKITINPIYQKIVSDTNYCGIELLGGAQVHIYVNGPIRTEFVENPTESYLFLEGVDKSISHTYSSSTTTTTMFGSRKSGIGGTYKFKNLTYHQKDSAIGISGGKDLMFDDCILKIDSQYAIASSKNIVINNSAITAYQHLFNGTNTVKIKDSNVSITNSKYSIFYGILQSVILEGNSVISEVMHTTPMYIGIKGTAPKITINDNASLIAKDIFKAKMVEINDNGSLSVTGNGNLLISDVVINGEGAKIDATNLIISGYYPTADLPANELNQLSSLSEFNNIASNYSNNKNNFVNGGSLTLINGTINISNQIGGNLDFELNINGGTLNSKYIGTSNYLYGVVLNSYLSGEVYQYSRISKDEEHIININDGIINVSENGYLGGMNAKININSGNINLGDNSIIGINENDTTTLVNSITSSGNTPSELVDININDGVILGDNGYINTPYSTLDIGSSNTNPSINLKDILADNGTINIKGATDHYDNPLGEGNRVGVVVNENLIAQNIEISNGAVVYAKNAVSKTNTSSQKGYLKVGENSHLYTIHYGTDGYGTSTITNNGTLVGNRHYTIQYVLNDTYTDPAKNTNPTSYEYGNTITLEDPIRLGYTFNGWYDNDGNRVTQITNTETGDKLLNARWTEKKVKFVISIKAEDVGLTAEEFATQVDESLGSLNVVGDTFTFTTKIEVSYHELLNTGLLLSNYNLKDYVASAAKIDNITLNPDGDILNLTSSGATVTREIMEYYINNSSEPIKISVCEFIQKVNE